MAVIDSLVVTLDLDTSGFAKGEADANVRMKRIRENSDRATKEIAAAGKGIEDTIRRTRNIALSLLGLFTVGRGVNGFVQFSTESGAALGRLSRDLGISARQISAWEAVSRRAGNAAGEVSSAFGNINQRIQNARLTGDYSQLAGFRALRVQINDTLTGAVRSTDDILQDALDAIARRAPQERLTFAQQIGGGQELVNLSAISRAERARMMAEGRADDDTPAQVEAATRRRDMFLQAERALSAVGKRLVEVFSPAIEAVAKSLRDFGRYLMSDEFKPVWEELQRRVKEFTDYLGTDDFKNAMINLGRGIVSLAEKVIEALRWMGLIPSASDPQQGPNPDGSVFTGQAPATPRQGAPSTGIAGWFQRRFEQQEDSSRRVLEERRNRPAPAEGTGPAGRRLSASEFRERFGVYARAASAESGVSEDIILGQMALESDWGRSFAGTNNPFNLTARPGVDATEGGDTDGQGRPIRQRFQNFPTPEAAAAEWAGRLRRLWPNSVGAGDDVGAFARGLRPGERGGYAEAPNYSMSLQSTVGRIRRSPAPAPTETPLPNPTAPAPDPGLLQGPRQGASSSYGGGNTNTSSVQIGALNVHTAATDAPGIARDLEPALRRHTFVDQSTVGLV